MINANKVFSMTADTRVSVRVKVGLWLGLQRSHWGGGVSIHHSKEEGPISLTHLIVS